MPAAATITASAAAVAFREPLHILGAGSMGLLWASSIRSKFPSYPVTLLLRDTHRKKRKSITWCSSAVSSASPEITQPQRQQPLIRISRRRHGGDDDNHDIVLVPVEFIGNPNDTTSQQRQQQSPIQNLIVTTKSYQAVQAIQSVLPRMMTRTSTLSDDARKSPGQRQRPRIVLLCNGALAVKEELQSLLLMGSTTIGGHDVHYDQNHHANDQATIEEPSMAASSGIDLLLATTTHGAYREYPASSSQGNNNDATTGAVTRDNTREHLVHAGIGKTFLEQQNEVGFDSDQTTTTARLGDLWDEVGLNCTTLSSDQMEGLLWNKLAANCIINPLTALYGCTNGELLLEPSFTVIQHDVLQEIAQVVTAAATVTSVDQKSMLSLESLQEFVGQVIHDTSNNKSSMYQDVVMGHRTEIEQLNGYVVRKGRELGVGCPANEDLVQRVLELERKNGTEGDK